MYKPFILLFHKTMVEEVLQSRLRKQEMNTLQCVVYLSGSSCQQGQLHIRAWDYKGCGVLTVSAFILHYIERFYKPCYITIFVSFNKL